MQWEINCPWNCHWKLRTFRSEGDYDFRINKCPRLSILYAKTMLKLKPARFIIQQVSLKFFLRQESVKAIAERCMLIRERLRERLRLLGGPWHWDHIIKPGGFYCCFGFNSEWCIIHACMFNAYITKGSSILQYAFKCMIETL